MIFRFLYNNNVLRIICHLVVSNVLHELSLICNDSIRIAIIKTCRNISISLYATRCDVYGSMDDNLCVVGSISLSCSKTLYSYQTNTISCDDVVCSHMYHKYVVVGSHRNVMVYCRSSVDCNIDVGVDVDT